MSYRLQVIGQDRESVTLPIDDELAESLHAGPSGLFHVFNSLISQVLENAGVELRPPLVVSLQHLVSVDELEERGLRTETDIDT